MRQIAVDRRTRPARRRPAADGSATADRLVACPLPLGPILAEGDSSPTTASPGPLLEVLTRRYYRIRALGPWRSNRRRARRGPRGTPITTARCTSSPSGRVPRRCPARARRGRRRGGATVPSSDTAVVDVYLPLPASSPIDIDALAAEFGSLLRTVDLPASVRRVSLIPSHPRTRMAVFTFRRAGQRRRAPVLDGLGRRRAASTDPTTFEEDVKFRGLHPMIARRLQMWRLTNFEISPLPAPGDVHLFDCVARDEPVRPSGSSRWPRSAT